MVCPSRLLDPNYDLNQELYDSGPKADMSPVYVLGFMTPFITLAECLSHVIVFNGKDIWRNWKMVVGSEGEDAHTKMMKVYPEVPQLWYVIFYMVMAALAIATCEVYRL
ncbi:hypothetical protein BGZ58_008852 [Dissophora ornata]|nr:hypothetical protein BGZ58_008852 [Dissophora ornata]